MSVKIARLEFTVKFSMILQRFLTCLAFCRLRESGAHGDAVKKAVRDNQRGLCFIKLV